MSASRMDSRAITTSAGSCSDGAIRVSGMGSNHETSAAAAKDRGGRSAPWLGCTSPEGRTRIGRGFNAVRHTLVAIV